MVRGARPEMGVYAGPLSAEFAAASRELDAKALADDPATRAAGVGGRDQGGPGVSGDGAAGGCLNVVVSGQAVLKECGEAFAQAARAGVYLGPGMDGWIRGAAELAQARGDASGEAARQLEAAPHRTVKLARATEVWKALADGEVQRLLRPAAEDDAARAGEVAAEVVRLRGGAASTG